MSDISLSKKLPLLLALSITATTVSLPANAWLAKNASSDTYLVTSHEGGSFIAGFKQIMQPGQIAACDAAEYGCGSGGIIKLCIKSLGKNNNSTNDYIVEVGGGMGVVISDYDVRTIKYESNINRAPTNPLVTYRLEPIAGRLCN
jgi:hypothetical protein